MKTGIINYDNCNINSIYYSLYNLGVDVEVVENNKNLKNYSKIILPGVGSSPAVMHTLKKKELINHIKDFINSDKPILGICVGMQILFNNLLEGSGCRGLNCFESSVKSIYENKRSNIGWRNVVGKKEFNFSFLNKDYYFCHSYEVDILPKEEKYVVARDDETKIISMIKKKNIYGVQFHPEKSQKNGIDFFNHFIFDTNLK